METKTDKAGPGLQAGQKFTPQVGDRLPAGATFVRWAITNGERQPDNFVDIVEGYHWQSYFGPDGRYIGSDEAGVEPVFAAVDTREPHAATIISSNGDRREVSGVPTTLVGRDSHWQYPRVDPEDGLRIVPSGMGPRGPVAIILRPQSSQSALDLRDAGPAGPGG